MVNTLGEVIGEVRSLIGAPDGDFVTPEYVIPLINIVQKRAVNYLEGTCSPFIEQVIDVPAIPAGTTNFIKQQTAGNPLAGLVNPLVIEYKQAGMPINQLVEAVRSTRLPNVAPNANPTTSGMYWEYRSYVLYLTPLSYNADFRVRGDFRPAPLLKNEDIIVVHPMFSTALSFGTAALIGKERGNQQYVSNYQPDCEQIINDIANELIRQGQGTTTRVGKSSRRGGWLFANR